MTVLFHSNILASLGMAIALFSCIVVLGFDRAAFRRGTVVAASLLLLNVPWAWYFDVLGKAEEKLYSFWDNSRSYLELTNRYTFPAAALVAFLVRTTSPSRSCTGSASPRGGSPCSSITG